MKPFIAMMMAIFLVAAIHPVLPQTAENIVTSGIVLAVDTDQRLLSLEEANYDGRHLDFRLGEDIEISKDGENIGLANVRVGDPVSVRYRETNGAKVVRRLEVIARPGEGGGADGSR